LIFWAAGPIWGTFSIVIVILSLAGLSIAQIISTSSNLYLLNWGIDKRLLSCIVGAVVSLTCFIPTYREYRAFTFLGLIATTYTAWYMTITSIVDGPVPNVDYTGPTTIQDFFTCFSAMVFMFGTHSAVIEKADVMNEPSRYDVAYVYSILYVYTMTLPNAITGYYRFGSEAATQENAFYLFDDTVYREIAVVLLCVHEVVAFGLFAGPLFIMAEKYLKIDHKHYLIKVAVRYIIVGIMLLFAIAFPFFGVINSVIGAFTATLATFIIPSIVYNMYFNTKDKFDRKAKNSPFNSNYMITKTVNYIIAFLIFIFGFCMGGWGKF
jgi:auxin influx carrier (AUX1 LAX family)